MIGNRNGSFRHWDVFMLHRWENEGGCLGPLAVTHRVSHSDNHAKTTDRAELTSEPTAIRSAKSDHPFAEPGASPFSRVDRQLRRRTRPIPHRRTTHGCSRAALTAFGPGLSTATLF